MINKLTDIFLVENCALDGVLKDIVSAQNLAEIVQKVTSHGGYGYTEDQAKKVASTVIARTKRLDLDPDDVIDALDKLSDCPNIASETLKDALLEACSNLADTTPAFSDPTGHCSLQSLEQ